MRLGRVAHEQLDELIAGAAPLEGDFFRSVAFQYFHPDDVISGEGTRLNGGRFAPVGVKAVYASFEEETAMREVNVRKKALGGKDKVLLFPAPAPLEPGRRRGIRCRERLGGLLRYYSRAA